MNSYEQYPLEKFFIFTIYQNYTLALNDQFKMLFSFISIDKFYSFISIFLKNVTIMIPVKGL